MRVRITNQGDRPGHYLVDYGDGDDERGRDRPLRELAPGASKEFAITTRGHLSVVAMDVLVEPIPRPGKARKPSRTKTARGG